VEFALLKPIDQVFQSTAVNERSSGTPIKTTEKHSAPWVKSTQRILDAATAKLDFVGRKKLRRAS